MKTRRILTTLLSLLCLTALHAATYEYNNFTFDLDVAAQTATLVQKSSPFRCPLPSEARRRH